MTRRPFAIWAIWLIGLHLLSQPAFEQQEQFLLDVEAKIDSLQLLLDQRINENRILSGQIQQNNSGEQRTYNEHRKLEKQLRKAQSLNLEIKNLETGISRLHNLYQDSLQALITAYQNILDRRMIQAQNAGSDEERDRYLLDSQNILSKKARWNHRLSTRLSSRISDLSLKVTPWDNPASLRLKRDALLDQEETIRHEVQDIENKIIRLQKEDKMRKKMIEMAGDMALFSESEETMDRVTFSGHTSERSQNGLYNGLPAPESNAKSFFDDQNDQLQLHPFLHQDPLTTVNSENPLNLEERIKIFMQYRDHLTARADSIQQKARWFDDQARQWPENQQP